MLRLMSRLLRPILSKPTISQIGRILTYESHLVFLHANQIWVTKHTFSMLTQRLWQIMKHATMHADSRVG
jgi:hypothetical protein